MEIINPGGHRIIMVIQRGPGEYRGQFIHFGKGVLLQVAVCDCVLPYPCLGDRNKDGETCPGGFAFNIQLDGFQVYFQGVGDRIGYHVL